ncbi:MAG: hypothetical protein WC495_02905 [Patescibacteria group bacterium]|jgi:hypothetical protein
MRNLVALVVVVVTCLFAQAQAIDVTVGGFGQGIFRLDERSTSSFEMKQAYVSLTGSHFFAWLQVSPGGEKLFSQCGFTTKIKPFNIWKLAVPGSTVVFGKLKPPSSRHFRVSPIDQATIYSLQGQGKLFPSRDFGLMWTLENLFDSTMSTMFAIVNGQDAVNSSRGADSNSAKDVYIRTTVKAARHIEFGTSAHYGKGVEFTNRIVGGDVFVSFPLWTLTLEGFWCDQKDEIMTGYGLFTVEPLKNLTLITNIEGIGNRTTRTDVWCTTVGVGYSWPKQKVKLAANFIDRSGDTKEPGTFITQLQYVF